MDAEKNNNYASNISAPMLNNEIIGGTIVKYVLPSLFCSSLLFNCFATVFKNKREANMKIFFCFFLMSE